MKRSYRYVLPMLVIIALVALLTACGKPPADATKQQKDEGKSAQKTTEKTYEALKTEGTLEPVKYADEWQAQYPKQYESYMENSKEETDYPGAPETKNYLEAYPALQNVYAGIAFSKAYDVARGHTYALDDIKATPRKKAGANCLACKTPNYVIMEQEMGNALYTADFNETAAKVESTISCYDCHENKPGEMHVNRTNLKSAVADYGIKVDDKTAACAQCHNEYYFDPETKAVKNPYKYGTDPESILKYYNEVGFVDFENPISGAKLLKAQHSEFETFTADGSVHAGMGLSCADCHMAEEDGYTSHRWTTPFVSQTIMEKKCLSCHKDKSADDMKKAVNDIQDKTQTRVKTISEDLETLNQKIGDQKDTLDPATLETVYSKYRDAEWYWDFVFVENGDGFHNEKLAKDCLDKSEALIKETNALLQ